MATLCESIFSQVSRLGRAAQCAAFLAYEYAPAFTAADRAFTHRPFTSPFWFLIQRCLTHHIYESIWPVIEIANQIGAALKLKGWMIATAESCTGGGIAEAITAVPGCSAWFDRAFVTYSYEAKVEALGVQQSSLDEYGAVSEQVVQEMARGALGHSRAHVAIAVSGIAGPAGGTLEKPVGSVWIAWATRDSIDANGALNSKVISKRYLFSGDREDVRQQTVVKALAELLHNL